MIAPSAKCTLPLAISLKCPVARPPSTVPHLVIYKKEFEIPKTVNSKKVHSFAYLKVGRIPDLVGAVPRLPKSKGVS